MAQVASRGLPERREISLAPSHAAGLVSRHRRSAEHAVEAPLVGDAFQLVLPGVFELEPRAGGEVFDRGADQNLPGVSECTDPGADVDREAADAVTGEFDLPGVAPGTDVQADLSTGDAQRL